MERRIDRVTIRTARADDVPALVSLINRAFAVEKFIDGTRTDEERFSETMHKGTLLVAERGGEAIACVYVELRGERAYFGMLAVDPARQHQGLGRSMTTAAENFGRNHGCKHMDISVLSLRPELLPLYRNLGYSEIGTEEFHPTRPLKGGVQCHCIVMSKAL
ncbi:MAG: GNAT family N-acetyltransferase [Candidatus Sulfotelmatobacter sp.]